VLIANLLIRGPDRVEALAFRPRDLADVETVVIRQGCGLDWEYFEQQLAPLAEVKESSEIMAALARLRQTPR
jgi:hypothetical protein